MKNGDTNDHRLLRSIKLENLLSFGPEGARLELGNLNILVGPNGSGKSNLIEALSLLRATPVSRDSNMDLPGVIRRGGGPAEWIWKGDKQSSGSVEVTVKAPTRGQALRHAFCFRGNEQSFRLADERIGNTDESRFFFQFRDGHPVVSTSRRPYFLREIKQRLSILAQLRDPDQYPEITYLAEAYETIRIYREWAFGRNTVFREPQRADMRSDRLEEDFSNLGLILSRLRKTPKVTTAILDSLKDLYEGVSGFEVIVEGGSVQIFFNEGDFSLPATRLSDGTLRYLCLLAILCDPEPAPLICIEETELGLHPDVLPKLADLLVLASERTQLIVTTHSDILVDAMTERPEAIVVCEKHDGKTVMRRLRKEDLAGWLGQYRLGQLWTKGQIGGTRWCAQRSTWRRTKRIRCLPNFVRTRRILDRRLTAD